jgi:hypothetical protein
MNAEAKRKMWLTINIVTIIFIIFMVNKLFSKYNEYQSIKKQETQIAEQKASALDQCMAKHRWDTTAVNTSRMAVQMHYHRKGQGELAKYVSDYDAVRIVYCSGN